MADLGRRKWGDFFEGSRLLLAIERTCMRVLERWNGW